MYEYQVGEVPPGLDLDHRCRVRRCCNPDHVRPVSRRENLLAPGSLSPAKPNSEKQACLRGHPFSPENTYHWRGGRYCRTCFRLRKADFRRRHA
jgi:hypothetical protein